MSKPSEEKKHAHAEARYRVYEARDGSFSVEVSIPGSFPTTVSGLADRAAAEAWVAKQQRLAENPQSQMRQPFRSRQS